MRRVATGIVNLGNTCFLSAVLQSLCCVRSFESFLDSLPQNPNDTRNVVAKLRESLKALSVHNGGTFNPASLIEVSKLREKFFSNGRQQDAQEFMEDLMSMIDESTNPPPVVATDRKRPKEPKPINLKGLDAAFAEFDFAPATVKRTAILRTKPSEPAAAIDCASSSDGAASVGANSAAFDETSSSCSDSDTEIASASANAVVPALAAMAYATSGPPSSTSSPAPIPPPNSNPNSLPRALRYPGFNPAIASVLLRAANHRLSISAAAPAPALSPANSSGFSTANHNNNHARHHYRTHAPQAPPHPRNSYLETNPFVGWLGSQLRCRGCTRSGALSTTRFVDLNLSFPEEAVRDGKECTIEECLRYFITAEEVTGVRCDGCNKRKTADKKMWIARPPKALCLHLRRLVVDRGLRPVKLLYRVKFDDTLNLLPFCSWNDNVFAENAAAGRMAATASSASASQSAGIGGRMTSAPMAIHRQRRDSKGFAELSTSPPSPFLSTSPGSAAAAAMAVASSPPSSASVDAVGGVAMSTSSFPSYLSDSVLAAAASSSLSYQLVAVIVHHGTASGGHFTTYRKQVPGAGGEVGGTWYHISDERVRQVTWREVQQAEAYMLFYERTSSGEPSTSAPSSLWGI